MDSVINLLLGAIIVVGFSGAVQLWAVSYQVCARMRSLERRLREVERIQHADWRRRNGFKTEDK